MLLALSGLCAGRLASSPKAKERRENPVQSSNHQHFSGAQDLMPVPEIFKAAGQNFRSRSEIVTECVEVTEIRALEAVNLTHRPSLATPALRGRSHRPRASSARAELAETRPQAGPTMTLSLGSGVMDGGYPRGAGRKVRASSYLLSSTKPHWRRCRSDRSQQSDGQKVGQPVSTTCL